MRLVVADGNAHFGTQVAQLLAGGVDLATMPWAEAQEMVLSAYGAFAPEMAEIARKLEEDVAYRVLGAENFPAHRTIAEFRLQNLEELRNDLEQIRETGYFLAEAERCLEPDDDGRWSVRGVGDHVAALISWRPGPAA